MNPFTAKQRFTAVLVKGGAKNVKQKGNSAQDGARVPMLDLIFHVEMNNTLSTVVQRLHKGANTEDWKDIPVPVQVNIYGAGDFTSKSDDAKHRLGGESGVSCVADVTKVFRDDEIQKFALALRCHREAKLWAWYGEMVGEGECVLEVQSLQPNLPAIAAEEPKRRKARKGEPDEPRLPMQPE